MKIHWQKCTIASIDSLGCQLISMHSNIFVYYEVNWPLIPECEIDLRGTDLIVVHRILTICCRLAWSFMKFFPTFLLEQYLAFDKCDIVHWAMDWIIAHSMPCHFAEYFRKFHETLSSRQQAGYSGGNDIRMNICSNILGIYIFSLLNFASVAYVFNIINPRFME